MSRHAGARVVAGAVLTALLAAAPSAHAQFTSAGDVQDGSDPAIDKRTTRSGLVVALIAGFGVAGSSGYPNSSSEIGNPDYFSSSDLLVGTGSTIFVGGALADWLNFGFWVGSQSFRSHDWRSTGGGGGFRVEAFPLYSFFPTLKNLGVEAQFGLGSTKLQAQNGNYPAAVGTQSFLGVGAFYEFPIFKALGGHAAVGPMAEYDAIYSTSIARGAGVLGVRFAFYGGM